jgi:hypothetical protein
MYPSGYKENKVYCFKPTDGSGDLTFTRASTATRVNESGLIESVATGVPRIDYTGGGCAKLLLEPQRTNLILNSEGVLAEYNTKIGNLTDASTSINSFANSIQVGDNSVLSALYKSTQSWAAGPTYSFSFFVQMDDNSQPIIGLNATTGDFAIIVGGVLNATTAKITRINSTDTYLVSVSTTQNGGSANYGIIKYTTQSAKPFRITAMQNEIGSYPTSYIPTTSGTAVTRTQENFNRLGLGLTNSTIFFEFTPTTAIAGLFDIYKTVGGRAYYVALNSGSFLTFNSVSGGTIGVIGSAITIGQNYKIAMALNSATSQLSVFLNGVKLGTYTTDITTLGGFYSMLGFGYVPQYKSQSIMVFPTNLSDTDAIALTTI